MWIPRCVKFKLNVKKLQIQKITLSGVVCKLLLYPRIFYNLFTLQLVIKFSIIRMPRHDEFILRAVREFKLLKNML